MLAERVRGLGIEISFDSRVSRLACDKGEVWLEDGSRIVGDLIVCADGMTILLLPSQLTNIKQAYDPSHDPCSRVMQSSHIDFLVSSLIEL